MIKNHKLTDVEYITSPNHGGTIDPRFIVMHYTAGFTAQGALNAYQTRRVSAHLLVDLDGTVYQSVPFNKAAWHAGPSRWMGYNGLNQYSIGIEIVNAGWFRKDGTVYYRNGLRKNAVDMPPMIEAPHPRVGGGTFWWPQYTDPQLDALDGLTSEILGKYDILDIVSHEQIDTRGWKTDPGPAFPMERYKRQLAHQASFDRSASEDPYQVTASTLNVRNGPGIEFTKIFEVKRGDIVNVIDEQGLWKRLDIDGNDDGWVHGGYLRRA
jgi:N-acetylmuramoyl-L-alanine amidase